MGGVNLISGGLDVQGIVDNLIAVESQPVQRLQAQTKTFQDKAAAYQSLNTKLLAFRTSVESILFQGGTASLYMPADFTQRFEKSLFALRKAVSSDESVVTATAAKGLTTGTYTLTVTQLAAYHSLASSNVASDIGTAIKTGTLAIQKGDGETSTITIDETNNTLVGIRNAINDADAGVTATILNDGSGAPYRLVITSDDSGTANSITLSNNLTGGDGVDVSFGETVAARDAIVQVNGVDITSSSNTISNAVEGVTFELKSGSGTAVISLERDADAIVAGIQDFVTKYNEVVTYISSQSKYDATKRTAGVLAGDFVLRQAQSRLSAGISTSVMADGYSMSLLSQAGIKLGSDGTLSLDETKLRDNLASDFRGTAHLFLADGLDRDGNTASILPALRDQLKGLTDTVDGPVVHATNAIQQNIRRINDQIDEMEKRLDVRREILLAQFMKADEALKQLTVLQTSVTGLMNSIGSE